ncbi:hypothetical protein ACMYUL_10850 [Neisseria sp. CP9]|uniref:hypothetical protein n=1 Tax=Neisseria sp. CP9 TaxID=3388843 RepID=UPI000F12056C|nr:MAG: hypothetical protein D8H97_21325 [Neisseria sp.]DAS18644.1 MAG TPA: minor tail protein Z [Bacteriophage sp.]
MPAIRVDVSKMVARLDDVQRRQVPFAAKNAVNKLAAQAIGNLQDEMRDSFFNPKPWTLNSLFVRQYATKEELTAVVDFKDGAKDRSAGKYLTAQIYGGSRRAKGIEAFLVSRGLMPAGYRIVPSDAVRLDRFGNITLAAFRAMVRGLNDGTHFALLKRRGKLSPGIYKRQKRKVKALVVYVSAAQYEKRLRYFEVAEQAVVSNQQAVFAEELEKAFATAR